MPCVKLGRTWSSVQIKRQTNGRESIWVGFSEQIAVWSLRADCPEWNFSRYKIVNESMTSLLKHDVSLIRNSEKFNSLL